MSLAPETIHPVPIEHWVALPAGRLFAREWRPDVARPGLAPLVMLHESLGCVALWRDFPARLCAATGRRVIAYDRAGFGRSDARPGRPSASFVADEAGEGLAALRAQLALDHFVLLGHSVGGGMALHAAAREPARCLGVVTIAAQAFVEAHTRDGIREAEARFAGPAHIARLAAHHGDKTAWVLDAWIGNWLSPAFDDWCLDDVLPRVACPVLALHGELDEYGSAAHPARIAAGVRGPAEVAILPGLGHLPHRQDPSSVTARIARFLATLPDAAGG